jgi:CRP-like cAMP-binding protein
MNALLLQTIRKHVSLNHNEADKLCGFFAAKSFAKKELLYPEGGVAKEVAFVGSGVMRVFALDQSGHEWTLQFAPADWWITDLSSFIKQQPSQWKVEALEPTEALLLSRENQLALFEEIPAMQAYFRIITENALVAHQQRLQDVLGSPALDRYKAFCLKYPSLVDNISQKYIASYIGVSPEFLSKMKAEILRGKR